MPTDSFDRLSRHERRVVVLAAQGCSNQQAADRLCVSTNTIKTHLARIFQKLQVHTKTEAVAVLMLDERFRDQYQEQVVVTASS